MRPRPVESAITAAIRFELYRRIARMSSREMRGLLRTLSNSSSLRVIGNCWMLNESAPAWLRMASLTDALSPWINDTTAMIDVTATMLPSTVMNDRSLEDQIASRAMSADSMNLFMAPGPALLLGLVIHLHQITVCHPADGIVRSGDHFVAAFQATEHFEILVARDPHLDGDEFSLARAHEEHALGFLTRLARFQLGGDGDRFGCLAALVGL